MSRRTLMGLFSLLLVACTPSSQPLNQVLPSSVDGWTRTEVTALDSAAAPDLIKQLGLKNSVSATYTGPATVAVRVYEMNVATSAFELIQKWRQQDGLAVYKSAYFVIADPAAGPNAAGLLEALRKQLP